MNKNTYRIVFNESRGCLMAVAETATSQGKSASGERVGASCDQGLHRTMGAIALACKLVSQTVLLSVAALWLVPMQAQTTGANVATRIAADPSAARNQQATVLNTSNGVVQVNIQTPSAAGVSRNIYSQFDVGNQGAILNNSRTNVQTQQGGWVQGNPWLATGSARVILNEVNSSNPSYLQGYVEVAGQRAEVIIANPSGIAVNGGGFLNASGVTLTTGTPIVNNGNLETYRVQRGSVSVDGAGLDTRTADYTAILSRAAQVNAGIWAKQLQVVTGANQIETSSLGSDAPVQSTAIAAAGTTPTYALDVGQLGGMYAGKIMLIGTEAGLGVRNAGLVQASNGPLTLTQEGWLSNSGTLQAAGGDVQIQTRGTIEQSGTVYSNQNVLLASQSNQTHSGTTAALGNVNIQAQGAHSDGTAAHIQASHSTVWAAGLQTDGQLSGQQNLTVQATGQVQTEGQALATNTLSLQGASLDLSQAHAQAPTLNLQASTGELNATASQLLATEQLQLKTPQALITDGAKVQAGTLGITANSLSNVAGQIVQTGATDQAIALQGSLNNLAGVIQSSANNLSISAQSIDNTAGQLLHAGSGTLALTSQGQLLNNSQSSAQAAVTDGARIVSTGALNISSAELANSGSVYAAKDLSTQASSLSNSGSMYAAVQQTLSVTNVLTSSGSIAAAKNLTVSAASLSGTSTHVLAAGMAADGQLTGTGALSVTTTGALQSAGQILATGKVSMTGASLDLSGSTSVTGSTTSDVSLSASNGDIITRNAQVSTPGLLTLTANTQASQKLDNTAGHISAAQLDIRAGQIDNSQGTIGQTATGAQTASIQSTGAIHNNGGSIIANAQSLSVRSGSALDNTDGLISATGQLGIHSGDLTNAVTVASTAARGIQSQTDSVSVDAQQLFNSGSMYAAKDLRTTATSVSNSGTLYAGGTQALSVTNAISTSGTIAAANDLTVSASTLAGSSTNVLAAGMASDGKLTGTGALSVSTTGSLQNAGQALATGNVTMTGANLDLSHSTTGSTLANVDLTAHNGNILTRSAQISSAGSLNITANASATQTLDNTSGQLSGKLLNLQVGQLVNARGSIEQTGGADLTIGLGAGTLDNSTGRIVSNAINLSLAAGTLNNAGGLIGHAGMGQLSLNMASLDNTRGQVIGNGAATLTSAGQLVNVDGLITASGDLQLNSADLSNTRTGAVTTSTGIQSQTGNLTLTAQALTNSANIYAAKDLAATAVSLSNSGTLYAGGDQALSIANALTSSGTVAAAKDLTVTAASLSGTSTHVLAAGMATDGKLTGTGALSVTTSGALQSAGQALATGNVSLTGAGLDLSGSVTGSTSAHVSLTAKSGHVQTNSAQISAADQLTITADSLNTQKLDNTTGQLSAKQLSIQVGQLDNAQGAIYQTGTGAQTANIHSAGTVNNSAGRIVANAQDLTLNANGELTNTDGLIGHAGSGTLSLSMASLDNTRGQIVGNGAATLASTGAVTNAGSIVAAKDLRTTASSVSNSGALYAGANQSLTVGNAITNSGTLAAATNLTVTAASLAATSASVIAAGMATDGKLTGTGKLSVATTGALQSAGQILATSHVNLTGASVDLSGTTNAPSVVGSTTGDVRLNANSGNILTQHAQVSTPGLLSITANTQASQKLDNTTGQLSGQQLNIQVGQLDNTRGVIQQTGTGVQTANIRSAGTVTNTGGTIVANAQDFTLQAGGQLDNTDGQIGHAGTGTFTLGTSATDNTRGRILGNAALNFSATGDVNNTSGLVAAQSLSASATGWNNSQGKLVSTQGDLSLHTTQNPITNSAGLIQSAQDLRLSLEGSANSLQNSQGKIIATRHATLSTGPLANDAGLIAAGRNLAIDTHGHSLSNLGSRSSVSSSPQGLIAGQQLDIHSGAVDNRAGLISAQGALSLTSTGSVNNAANNGQASLIYSGSDLSLQAASLDNTASQILAVGNASLNTGSGNLTNTTGLVRVGQTLTVQSASVDNSLTRAFNSDGTPKAMGLEGNTIALTTAHLNNTQGAVRAAQDLALYSDGQLINDQGELSAGRNLLVTTGQASTPSTTPTLRISNQAGQILADQSVNVRTGSLSGAGTLASKGDVTLSLQGDHTLAGTLQAGGNLSLSATGQITNPISVQAGKNLSVIANNLDNQASGELLSGQTTQLTISNTLTNRGLIDGADTRIQAGTVNNLGTGRLYGDRVAIAATTLTNQEETVSGVTHAATIAGRERVDLGVRTLTNRENALIYSGGDMAIGGALDASWRATGTAQLLNNNSATIEAASNMVLGANQVHNTNDHLQWILVDGQPQKVIEFQGPDGQRYAGSDVLLISNRRVGGSGPQDVSFVVSGNDWRCNMGGETCSFTTGGTAAIDQYYKGLLLPSAQYPFEKFAPYYNPSYIDQNGQVVRGYMQYSGDRWAGGFFSGMNIPGAHYAADHRIWSDFGVTPYSGPLPVISSTNPCASIPGGNCAVGSYLSYDGDGNAVGTINITQANVDEYNTYQQRLAARDAADAALDAKLNAFYADIYNRWIGDFTFYEYNRSSQTAQVTQSAPGKISAGGNLQWTSSPGSGQLTNQDSTIVVGGSLNAVGGTINNQATQVDLKSTDTGYAFSTWNAGTGVPNRGYGGTEYGPVDTIKQQALSLVTYTEHAANASTGTAPTASTLSTVAAQASGLGTITAAAATASLSTVAGAQTHAATASATNNQTQAQVQSTSVSSAAAQATALPGQTASLVQTSASHAAQAQATSTSRATGQTVSVGTVSNAQAQGSGLNTQTSAQVQGPSTASAPSSAAPGTTNANAASALTAVRTAQPNTQIPNTSLYKTHPETGAKYLVETDPQFTQYKTWLGSEYMLSALNQDPAATQKRLGDGFYEQKLVRDQVLALTGNRFLGNYQSDEQQYMALMNSGLTYASQWNLRPGIALTPDQIAQLTSDMVWLVTQEVTLADGSRQSVLVPQVYVRVKPGDLDGSGALLAGADVNLNLSGDLSNSGTIAGRNAVQVSADNIRNLAGTISADSVSLNAKQDIDNIGGLIEGVSAAVAIAGRDINLSTTTQSSFNTAGANSFAQTGIDRVAGLYVKGEVGTLVASAGRDLNLTAAQIGNAGSGATVLAAGNNLNLSAVSTGSSQSLNWDANNRLNQSSSQDVGTQINTGGSLILSAGNDLSAKAATVNAAGALSALAGHNINITAGQATLSLDEAHQHTSSGFLSSSTTTTRNQLQSTTAVASNFEGQSVSISAGQDLSVKGSNVLADQNVSLNAGGNVKIEAAQNTQSQSSFSQTTTSGLMSGGGIGFTVGSRMQSVDGQGTSTTAAGSTVGSTGGNVTINAGRAYTQTGSDVLTPNGNIDISAKAVTINEARETGSQSTEQKFKQSGLTVALTSPVISALQMANNQINAAGNTSSSRMQALAAANAAINLKQGADAIQAGQAKEGGNAADKAGGIGISISAGASSSQSRQQSSADSARGSTLTAGGKVSIAATGAGKDSDITIQGSDIKAGGQASLKADDQVSIVAAQNTTSESSSSKNSSGSVGVGFNLGAGGAQMGITVSASTGKGQGAGNSTTYTNSHVTADKVQIESGGDTTLKGGVVSAEQVTAKVGGNLTIESLQDSSQYKEKSQQVGGSVTVGPASGGSVNLAQTRINSDYLSVGEQSAIRAGDGGFNISVDGKTNLTGGQITSTQAAIDNNKNSYASAGGTETKDLQNSANYSAQSVSVGLGAGSPAPGQSLSAGMSGVGMGSDKGSTSSITTAGISGVRGNAAARTGDKETGIKPIFDADKVKKEIDAQVKITQEFNKQAGNAISSYANNQRKVLQDQAKSATTPEEKAQAEQAIKDVNMQERALNILVSAFTGMAGATVTKEALSTAAEKMRDLMIEDSKKSAGVVDSTGKVLSNVSGPSDGVRGDRYKIGGTRVDLDLLCGPDNARCTFTKNADGSIDKSQPVQFKGNLEEFLKTPEGQKMAGITGGVQGAAGTLFGFAYEKGSWQDKLIESFAGSHDMIGGKLTGLYDEQGNAKRGMSSTEKFVHDRAAEIAIPIAAPFAAAEGMSPEVWKAIGILLGAGR